MKMKKILAAIAASTMAIAMLGMTASAEGTDAEEDTIVDETPADEEVVDEPTDEEVPADEEAPVDEEVPAEEAPVDANPATGNSPIALAVIPVALAAAAVVAKKVK